MGFRNDISAIVVNYNSGGIIENCFSGISEISRVIVVDNGSRDDSVAGIREKHPDFQILENHQNLGYGSGVNRGLAVVTTPYVLTVSPDTKTNSELLEKMHDVIREDERIACVVPGLSVPGHGTEFWVMGPGELHCRKADFDIVGHFCTWFTSGAAALYRTDALKNIGGFDENIFLYNEDCDLSFRLSEAGYSMMILPELTAHHINSGSAPHSVRLHWRKDWNYAWGMLYLLKKHRSAADAWRQGLSIVCRRAPKALFYLLTLNVKRFTRDSATFMGALNFLLGNRPTPGN